MTKSTAPLHNCITGFYLPHPPAKIGVAVSGGSDSLALLLILHDWHKEGGPPIWAATVDHGLRPESAQEAQYVSDLCADLGIPHETLKWQGAEATGNLQAQARYARYSLLADWARRNQLGCVSLGHTADDQAETLLMRLSREAGVDGLAAMEERRCVENAIFCRPLLNTSRQELQDDLTARQVTWVDDPSNHDDRFLRVRTRKALAALSDIGLTAQGLSEVAHHMLDVKRTLYWYVFISAQDHVEIDRGDVVIDLKGFRALRPEIARRLLQGALNWMTNTPYPPRRNTMDLLLESIRGGTDMTLSGCMVTIREEALRISREPNAVSETVAAQGQPWDDRWHLTGPVVEGAEIRALGEAALGLCPDRHETGLPGRSLAASPALWKGETLIAAPLAGLGTKYHATLLRAPDEFYTMLLSH